jgi:polyhydroxybutyrate depolymerase
MTMFKSMAFAGTVAALSSLSFAWSIDGVVSSKAGQPLSGVKISSFNYAGLETVSAADGKFALSYDDGVGLQMLKSVQAHVGFNHNVITISGIKAQTLTVSVMDALGKVAFSRTLHNVFGLATFDLNKTNARGAKYIRINADGNRDTYQLGKNVALMKDGDPLPTIMFTKDGYNNFTYTMKSFTESNVQITMDVASAQQSSSSQAIASSSSAKPESSAASSSSAKIEEVINCTGKTYQAGDHKMSVNVDGKNRTFIMHVPSAYKGDKPVPLVVDYHPIGGSGQGQLQGTTYKSQTDPEGVISLYPDGTGGKSMMGAGWNVGPCCSNDDDVKFSREMIKSVEEKVCIDTKRVYATGFSMGGGMSNHVACYMSDIYAAVAPAAMDLNKTNSATCNPDRPISIIMFRGTNDPVCKYQGGDSGFNDGLNFLGAEGNFNFWKEKNGCSGSPSKNSNGCNEYSNCKDGTKVVLCTKQGGGHDQGDGKIGWPFLKSFTLP